MEAKFKLHEQKSVWWLNHAIFFLAGMLFLFLPISQYQNELLSENNVVRNDHYEFINPLLDCKGDVGLETTESVSLKQHIEGFINNEIKNNFIKSSAVYFRDLNNGSWFVINEKEKFNTGSLLKVPLLVGYLKKAEINPQILEERVKFARDDGYIDSQYTKPAKEIKIGKTYTVEELIYRAIVYSDNKAARQLFYLDNGASFFKVFHDLLPHYRIKLEQPLTINIKDYSKFFTVLYNATYLNREMSDIALRWLTEVDFKKGLREGIPSYMPVAHKFGERGQGRYLEFHDCGIVYYPQHSYLLCVMSKGENEENLIKSTKDSSNVVYQYIDMQSKNGPQNFSIKTGEKDSPLSLMN